LYFNFNFFGNEMALSRAQLADPNCVVADGDYDAILSAIMETARGRWFLSEYARRNRHANTDAILSAVNNVREMLGLGKKSSPPYLIQTALSTEAALYARAAPATSQAQKVHYVDGKSPSAQVAPNAMRLPTPRSDFAITGSDNNAFIFDW
ncbi:MAG TPA: hypothetical protein VGI75_13505, partial [Pirellulales bacterium]